jgi:hypothetical protein
LCEEAVKLVADNKLSCKNAFDVQLIEHMSELITAMERGEGEMNFHRAAGTLDASARIYAYRVDQVYTDLYKARTGLANIADASNNENGEAKAKGGKNTLETARHLTKETSTEPVDAVDPFFKQMARQLENGEGAKALLLNILPYNRRGGLVFDGYSTRGEEAERIDDGPAEFEMPRLRGRVCPGLDEHLAELPEGIESQPEEAPPVPGSPFNLAPPPPPEPESPQSAAGAGSAFGEEAPAEDFDDDFDKENEGLNEEQRNAELQQMLGAVRLDSDFDFFENIWKLRRKEKRDKEEREKKEEKEKKAKVKRIDLLEEFRKRADDPIALEAPKRKPVKRKKKAELFEALDASLWPANPNTFFRLDWLDKILAPGKFREGMGKDLLQCFGNALDVDDGQFGDAVYEDAPPMDEPPLDLDIDVPPTPGGDLVPVPYAKTSKHVNVGAVKIGMRGVLEALQDGDCGLDDDGERPAKRARTEPETSFGALHQQVQSTNSSEISVAIAFICTLHMCNDMNLELSRQNEDDLGDFQIRIPPKNLQLRALEAGAVPALAY